MTNVKTFLSAEEEANAAAAAAAVSFTSFDFLQYGMNYTKVYFLFYSLRLSPS